MKRTERTLRSAQNATPIETAGADLFATPIAGAAAVGALGLGLASHAVGMWLGAMMSAAEASQRLVFDTLDTPQPPKRRKPAELRLVETPASEAAAAAARTARADAEIAAREAVRATKTAARETIDDAATIAKVAARSPMTASAPAKPRSMERPARPDDLKAISGVGPKLEKVLNGLGVWTYAQVAAFSEAEIAWLDEQLGFSGRIARDDWTGQAKTLAAAGG